MRVMSCGSWSKPSASCSSPWSVSSFWVQGADYCTHVSTDATKLTMTELRMLITVVLSPRSFGVATGLGWSALTQP
jgi:hypothetical protein